MRLLAVCACLVFVLVSDLYQSEVYGLGRHRRAKSNCCQLPSSCPVAYCLVNGQLVPIYDKGHERGDGKDVHGHFGGNPIVSYGQGTHGLAVGGITSDAKYLAGGINVGTGMALSGHESNGLIEGGRIGNTVRNGVTLLDAQSAVGHGLNNGIVSMGHETHGYTVIDGHEIGDHRFPDGNGLVYNPDGTIIVDGRAFRLEGSTLGGNSGSALGSFGGNGFVSNSCGCGN